MQCPEAERRKVVVQRVGGTMVLDVAHDRGYDRSLFTLTDEQAAQLARDISEQLYGPISQRLIVLTGAKGSAAM